LYEDLVLQKGRPNGEKEKGRKGVQLISEGRGGRKKGAEQGVHARREGHEIALAASGGTAYSTEGINRELNRETGPTEKERPTQEKTGRTVYSIQHSAIRI